MAPSNDTPLEDDSLRTAPDFQRRSLLSDKKRSAFGAFTSEGGFLDNCPACGHTLCGHHIFTHIHSVDEDELDTLIIMAAFGSRQGAFGDQDAPFLYELSLLHHGE